MKLALFGLFLFVLHGLTTAADRVHIYVPTPMTWTAAQTYCKVHHVDLSTITSMLEHRMLTAAAEGDFTDGWIGLYRQSGNPNIWLWSDGQLRRTTFDLLSSYNTNSYDCVYAAKLLWHNDLCEVERPFFCYDNFKLNLVMVNKTWEEALEYCRSNYTDLASGALKSQLDLVDTAVIDSKTVSVWTGLHFLAGEWHWVSRNFRHLSFQGSLPSCPAEPYHCGARNKNNLEWENRDCKAKFNFLCY